jgi:zinc/manganese transport system substrate-binding protein
VAGLVGAAVLTACGSTGGGGSASDGPTVVASTTVYADIARRVAGGNATVEAVISDPTADPHSYEASPADAAAVTTADLVVYNGAGYDAFVDRALDTAGDVPVVRAVDEFAAATGATVADHAGGHADADGGHADEAGTNEHAQEYRDNARDFTDALTPLEDRLDQIHDRGRFRYAQTERVAAHLFDAAHLEDLTPRGFLSSVEDDTDPSAADLAAMLDLVSEGRVAFLAFNTQTVTPVTSRVRDAAEEADLVVVDLTETLPEGSDYVTWMTGIVDSLSSALAGATPAADGGH